MEQIAINILPKGAKPVCHSSQFDEGRQIRFNLFNDDIPYTLSGTETISVLVHKPDGAEVVDSVTNTSDSYVIWDVSADACELSGVCECELSITKNGIVLGSKNFTMKVEEDAYNGKTIEVRTASGRIATFSTNMVEAFKSLKSGITPVQDLHGYSKPWSGGGGKNKLEPCITSGTVNGITYTVNDDGTIKLSNTATSEAIKAGNFDLKAGSYIYTSGVTESFDTYDTYLSIGGTTIARGISGYNSFTLAQDSTVMLGVRVRNGITPNVTIKPMIRLAGVSDASFEPYSNICPISGFSALNVTRTGKNLFNPSDVVEGYTSNTSGAINGVNTHNHSSGLIKVIGGEKYIITTSQVGGQWGAWYDASNNFISGFSGYDNPITAPNNAVCCRFTIEYNDNNPSYASNVMFEKGETRSTFELYKGSKYQSYFSGLANGTYGFVDLGSLTWTKISMGSGRYGFRATIPTMALTPASSAKINALCEAYEIKNGNDVYLGNVGLSGWGVGTHDIAVYDDTLESGSAVDFKSAMSGVYLIYELATPTTPTITQSEIDTLITAFNADLVTVIFGQTVYGGVADVTNGKLIITHEYCVFNGTETITSNQQGGHTRFSCQKLVNLADNSASNENYCSHFIASSSPIGQNQTDNAIGVYNRGLYWRADQFADVTAMKNYLLAQYNANTPIMYVAKLATPIEITTTPENLTALSGQNNNVYADTNGDTTVEYYIEV